MRLRRPRFCLTLLACAAPLLLAGCASSKKSSSEKSRQVILTSEYDDERAGARASQDVAAQMGLLGTPELDTYIDRIGRKLLRGMPRAFQYKFSVVDQVEPNAFALPGGYIFISRGLLALVNDEDELANVIGHEIVHSARRHAAAQQAMARRNPLAFGWQGAAQSAAYGRDMERTADREGQRLAAAAGYDPMGMSAFMRSLNQLERLKVGHSRMPSFFDSHPGTGERAAVNASRADELRWRRDPALGDTRASLLRVIDGLEVGQRPQAGIFVGETFLHPDLDFHVRFPRGWQLQNTAAAVGARAPRGEAIVSLAADQPSGEPQAMAEEYVARTNADTPVSVEASQAVKVGSLDAWRVQLKAGGRGGSIAATMTFIPYRGATWRITGMAPSRVAARYEAPIRQTSRSFGPLTERERQSVATAHLRLVKARPGEDLRAISQRAGNDWDLPTTAVYNAVFVSHRFEGGETVKVTRIEPYVARAAAR